MVIRSEIMTDFSHQYIRVLGRMYPTIRKMIIFRNLTRRYEGPKKWIQVRYFTLYLCLTSFYTLYTAL